MYYTLHQTINFWLLNCRVSSLFKGNYVVSPHSHVAASFKQVLISCIKPIITREAGEHILSGESTLRKSGMFERSHLVVCMNHYRNAPCRHTISGKQALVLEMRLEWAKGIRERKDTDKQGDMGTSTRGCSHKYILGLGFHLKHTADTRSMSGFIHSTKLFISPQS